MSHHSCCCCKCKPDGASYWFDRTFDGLSQHIVELGLNGSIDTSIDTTNSLGESTGIRVQMDGTFGFNVIADDHDIEAVGMGSLVDRSHDGHCGIGTGLPDIGPNPIDDGVTTGLEFPVFDSRTETRQMFFGQHRNGTITLSSSEYADITLDLYSVDATYDWRVIADSVGHNQHREGMMARLRGDFAAGADDIQETYSPCVLVEAKVAFGTVLVDVFGMTYAEIRSLVDDGVLLTPACDPLGAPAVFEQCIVDYVTDLVSGVIRGIPVDFTIEDGNFNGSSFAMTALVYLKSGQTRKLFWNGKVANGAFTGGDGYPATGIVNVPPSHDTTNSPAIVSGAILGATDLVVSAQMTSSNWTRSFQAFYAAVGANNTTVTRRMTTVMNSASVNLLLPLVDGVSSDQLSMLKHVAGWTSTADSGDVERPNAYSVYRPCGGQCGLDLYVHVDDGIIDPFVDNQKLYIYTGIQTYRIQDSRVVSNPTTSAIECADLIVVYPCADQGITRGIRIRKGAGFVSGASGFIDGVRYQDVGENHPDVNAPTYVFTDAPCLGDGTDRRIAVLCTPALYPDAPAGVAYDLIAMPVGSLTYIVDSIPYLLTVDTTSAPLATGTFSSSPCPEPSMLAFKCGDSSVKVGYLPSDRTVDGVTFLFNGNRYTPTAILTLLSPVAAQWTTDECDVPDQWYKAVLCNTPPVGTPFGTYRYLPGAAPVGQGGVLVWVTISVDPITGIPCTAVFAVQPTDIEADMTELAGVHIATDCRDVAGHKTGCSTDIGDPSDPNALMQRPSQGTGGSTKTAKMGGSGIAKRGMVSEAELDAMGYSPEREKERMRQGGCCGPPSPID